MTNLKVVLVVLLLLANWGGSGQVHLPFQQVANWWIASRLAYWRYWEEAFNTPGDDRSAPIGPSKEGERWFVNRVPYLVSIRKPGCRTHVCTGVLITKEHVLTAAHCVDQSSAYSAGKKPIVHIGATSIDEVDEGVEVMLVSDSYIHPNWDFTQRSPFNVAILKLEDRTEKLFPILFDHPYMQTGQQLFSAGWGAGRKSISVGSGIFRSAKLEDQEFIQLQHCNKPILWNRAISKGLFCAFNRERKSSCIVDSGSPLLLVDQPKHNLSEGYPNFDFVIGINIDGAPCGTPNKPDIYISMEYLHDWIAEKILPKNA